MRHNFVIQWEYLIFWLNDVVQARGCKHLTELGMDFVCYTQSELLLLVIERNSSMKLITEIQFLCLNFTHKLMY